MLEDGSSNGSPADGTTKIKAGSGEATKMGAWNIRYEESNVTIEEAGGSYALVEGVVGEMLEGGEIASRFVSGGGRAYTDVGRLVLTGNVHVTSEDNDIYMTDEQVTYTEDTELIEAEGTVWVRSETWNLGPFDKLVSNPSLTEIGTPDRYQ